MLTPLAGLLTLGWGAGVFDGGMPRDVPLPKHHDALERAADDARKLAGDQYFAGAFLKRHSNTVELYLVSAPPELLTRLSQMHPGTYTVIDNQAPKSLSALLAFMDSFDPSAWKTQGVDVVQYGPTYDGYLEIGVITDLAAAQAKFDATYGSNWIRVTQGRVFRAC